MKPGFLALVTLVATTSLAAPATAQRASVPRIPIIRSESQDFFQQGREQFEGEIQFLTLKNYLFNQDLLKIRELPPLEDGPFSFELSDAFTLSNDDKTVNNYRFDRLLSKCGAEVKKDLSVRVHSCPDCGYTTDRDVASGQVIRNRGIALISTLGHSGILHCLCRRFAGG